MSSSALRLVDLESLLRARKLGATLAAPQAGPATDAASLEVPALDTTLGGGLARGHVSELVGAASSGRTALMSRLLAAATSRGEVVALVDAFDTFDPESAADAGIDLTRLLWVRDSAPRGAPTGSRLDRAVKAIALVLQAGGFGIAVLDIATAAPHALAHLPFTTWLRIQRLVDGRSTACVLVAPMPLGRTPGGVTLTLTSRPRWCGTSSRARLFHGFDVDVAIKRTRIANETMVTVQLETQ